MDSDSRSVVGRARRATRVPAAVFASAIALGLATLACTADAAPWFGARRPLPPPAPETPDAGVSGTSGLLSIASVDGRPLAYALDGAVLVASYAPTDLAARGAVHVYHEGDCGFIFERACKRTQHVRRTVRFAARDVRVVAPDRVEIALPEKLRGPGAYRLETVRLAARCVDPSCAVPPGARNAAPGATGSGASSDAPGPRAASGTWAAEPLPHDPHPIDDPMRARFSAEPLPAAASGSELLAAATMRASVLLGYRGRELALATSSRYLPPTRQAGPPADAAASAPGYAGRIGLALLEPPGPPGYRRPDGGWRFDPLNFAPPFSECDRLGGQSAAARQWFEYPVARGELPATGELGGVTVTALVDGATRAPVLIRVTGTVGDARRGRRDQRDYHFCGERFLGMVRVLDSPLRDESAGESWTAYAQEWMWRFDGERPHDHAHNGFRHWDDPGRIEATSRYWNRVGAEAWPDAFGAGPDVAEFARLRAQALALRARIQAATPGRRPGPARLPAGSANRDLPPIVPLR